MNLHEIGKYEDLAKLQTLKVINVLLEWYKANL